MVANLFQVYIHDGEGQTILGIGDGTVGQKLCVELINNSEDTVVFDQADPQKPHFEVIFRPGTVFEKNIEKITSSATIFKKSSDPNNKDLLDAQKIDCQKLSNKQLADNSFYFSYQNNSFFFFCNYKQNNQLIKLEKGDKLLFTLENISAEPAGGSRGTRIELKYQSLTYETTSNPVSGNQLQYLNIVNQRGSKNLPLYVGFIGSTDVITPNAIVTAQDISVTTKAKDDTKNLNNNSYTATTVTPEIPTSTTTSASIRNLSVVGSNRVLNDGKTENALILTFRYLNRLQDNPKKTSGDKNNQNIQSQEGLSLLGSNNQETLDAATKFRITFDVLEDDVVVNGKSKYPDSGYRLLRTSDANAVKIKVYDSNNYLDEDKGSKQWNIQKDGQGNTRQWVITCKQNSSNLTDEILRLEISGLKTNLQAGYANLYVYYENIPGYWDGHIICPIEKGPLMLAKDEKGRESVGIGTTTPLAKLHVENKVVTETKIAYFKGNSGIQIDGTTGKYNALLISNNATDIPALFVEQKGKGEAAHFGGSVQIAIDGQSKSEQPALGVYQTQNTQPAAVFVGGKVGIGTANPEQTLDVNGNIYVRNGIIQKGGTALTQSIDLGLYSQDETYWLRLVTNKAPIRFFTDSGIGKDIRMSVESNGNVGIGTTDSSPAQAKLDVRGDVKVEGGISCGGKIGIKYFHGDDYLSTVNNGCFKSKLLKCEEFNLVMVCSRDFKENIVSISPQEATNTLQQLNPVKYDYKNEKAFRPNIGFIAEEMPDNLASYDKKSISPFEVTPILTRVVQEQQKAIALLQQKVDELQSKVE
jgi:hypothetical protein